MNDEAAIPALAVGVKFRFDTVRQAWVVLAPERLFLPDEQAVAILTLVDGARTLGAIIDDLAARFDAHRRAMPCGHHHLLCSLSANICIATSSGVIMTKKISV